MSLKDNNDEQLIHSKSNNIEIMVSNETDKIIN